MRERVSTKDSDHKNFLALGQVVLIADKTRPRVVWKLGMIVKLFEGRDGKVRSVELKTENGLIVRPISLLYPLELHCTNEFFQKESSNCEVDRPTRSSAEKAREAIRSML